MGHVLSEKGIAPAEEKVKAILEAREPTTASEGTWFLGIGKLLLKVYFRSCNNSTTIKKDHQKGHNFLLGKRPAGDAGTLAYFDGRLQHKQ